MCVHFYKPLAKMESIVIDVNRNQFPSNEAHFPPISDLATRLTPEQAQAIENFIIYLEHISSSIYKSIPKKFVDDFSNFTASVMKHSKDSLDLIEDMHHYIFDFLPDIKSKFQFEGKDKKLKKMLISLTNISIFLISAPTKKRDLLYDETVSEIQRVLTLLNEVSPE